jgi:hypothetical protein
MPDDETQRRRTTMKKETQRQHWTQEEVKTAIAKAIEHEPEGPNKDYWASDLTVDAVKRKYRTTKFKPSPWKIVLVRQCCGEKFSHVLANKRQAKGLDDWRCPGVECRLRTTVLPFGKYEGQTLRWVHEQEPSYLAWFYDTVDGYEEVKEAIRALDGFEAHLAAFREKRRQPGVKPLSPTQQQVEWLMGKFSSETVDKVCSELFGGQ